MGIYFDKYGFVVVQDGDGGDSAHFTGLYLMATQQEVGFDRFMTPEGGVRHPYQTPWDNPKNLSRDQTMPLAAGLFVEGRTDMVEQLLVQAKWRGSFAQNIERDAIGTTKYPWPHYAHRMKDNPHTKKPAFFGWPVAAVKLLRPVLLKTNIVKVETGGDWVSFDYADPLLPHHMLALHRGAMVKAPKWLEVLSLITFVIEAFSFKFGSNDDQGAILATAYLNGWLKLYKALVTDWEARCDRYFIPRGLSGLGEEVKRWMKTV